MSRYAIRAVAPSGEIHHFSREATTENEVALKVLREGLTPISIVQRDGGLVDILNRPIALGNRQRVGDVALFCEQMGTMTASGLTVEQALRVISKQRVERETTKTALRLLPRIQTGMSLSTALAAEPGLPPYLPGMIRAAETGGKLSEGLADAGRYMQRQASTRNGLLNALAYPAVVLITVVIALALVLIIVIPSFEPIFAGEEHQLPAITRAVLWLSNLAVHHLLNVSLFTAGTMLMGGALLYQFPTLRHWIHKRISHLRPMQLVVQLDVSRVLGVMGMLLRSGVEVSEAVALAARAAASGRLRTALEGASRQLREGVSISVALGSVAAIPDDTRALIEVGEHTGELGVTTLRASQLLESDTSYQIGRLVALANPIAIAFLGVAVGLVVGGVMLGILSINQLALRS